MRQPKTFLLLGTVLGIFMLSIAYAAIQNITLEVSGTATATPDQANFDVKLSDGYSSLPQVEYLVSDVKINNDTSATVNVSNFKKIGDQYQCLLFFENNSSNLNASYNIFHTSSNSEYFSVNSYVQDSNDSGINDGILDYNSTASIILEITLIKLPIKEAVSTSIHVDLIASPVHPGIS